MTNIYKVITELLKGDGLSHEMKKGILMGIELMGYQGENWLNDAEFAEQFRNNTTGEDGSSGWKDTYENVSEFLFSEEPDENEIKKYDLRTSDQLNKCSTYV